MIEGTGNVIRILHGIEIRLMAAEAIRVHKIVVAVLMAIGTVRRGVLAGQRKLCGIMIERRRFPCERRMATRAVVIQFPCRVIGTFHRRVILLMTTVAICRKRDAILSVFMTLLTFGLDMITRQRKERLSVIEHRRFP